MLEILLSRFVIKKAPHLENGKRRLHTFKYLYLLVAGMAVGWWASHYLDQKRDEKRETMKEILAENRERVRRPFYYNRPPPTPTPSPPPSPWDPIDDAFAMMQKELDSSQRDDQVKVDNKDVV